ncbi:DRTGG domain [uncultured Clostridium sp.]|nr:DRTGG domain [uncultured Clostridium sp.]
MKLCDVVELTDSQVLVAGEDMEREITSGHVCDLLSFVMAHAKAGGAWVTVQTHLNVIAVATLLDLGCVIVPEGIAVEEVSLDKAKDEGVCVLSSPKTAFELCGLLYEAGLRENSGQD